MSETEEWKKFFRVDELEAEIERLKAGCGCSQEEGFLCPTHAVLYDKAAELENMKLQNDELGKQLSVQLGQIQTLERRVDAMRPVVEAAVAWRQNVGDEYEGKLAVAVDTYAGGPLSVKRNCPSTYTHSSLGKLSCEKDEAHLGRVGDVEHRRGMTIWMSV
jgi:hypothetical protein